VDLNSEGIWGEVMYPSLGMWSHLVRDRELSKAAARGQNEWLLSEVQAAAPDRLVPVAHVPLLDLDDAAAEVEHAASIGLHAVGLPTGVPSAIPDYQFEDWDPLWGLAEEAGMVIGFHVGTDGGDTVKVRGPGGAIFNYVETTYGAQRAVTKLVAGGALDRHPRLKVLVSEGGATWVPFLGDRMEEACRQHGMFVRPALSRPPKEILYSQVYASFQHDESAPAASWAMGYRNVTWGSDYPHLEGTFGHTQDTLHSLFDGIGQDVRYRITRGAFEEMFPHVSAPPLSDEFDLQAGVSA
jgi:predicted TIM-barrel fold metal-dependent hydrolase